LAANVLTSPLTIWAHQRGSGLAFDLDATGYPENVIAYVVERLNAADGWTARRDGNAIHVERDRDNRRPIFWASAARARSSSPLASRSA
jgi:hypothetical protein